MSKSQKITHSIKKSKKEGNWFLLSDGKEYHQDQLIVGDDEIREYKLKKII